MHVLISYTFSKYCILKSRIIYIFTHAFMTQKRLYFSQLQQIKMLAHI